MRDDGAILKVYENDCLPPPKDVSGSVGGAWCTPPARPAQFTDTSDGTYWCAVQTGPAPSKEFSITLGAAFADSNWFRGRDTASRVDARVARWPTNDQEARLAEHWWGHAWPSAKLQVQVLAPLLSGTFPGVDDAEVYWFLEAHAGS